MRGLIAHSGSLIDNDEAAFLFATGKSELEIRNSLALYMHRNLDPSQIALREWKRHDLAVIDQAGIPMLIIEGKVWSHTDAITPTKLTGSKKSIKAALEADIKKLAAAKKKYPDVHCFITTILFSIDVTSHVEIVDTRDIVKYEPLHRRGLKAHHDLDLLTDAGHMKVRELMDRYGQTMYLPMWEGEYRGMRVKSEILILEPDN